MGGKSKSSSKTGTIVADGGSIIATEGSTVEFMSDEALALVLDFASGEGTGSRELVENILSGALETFVTQQNVGYQAVTDTAFKAIDSQRSEGAETFKYLLYAGVAVAGIAGAAYVFRGAK